MKQLLAGFILGILVAILAVVLYAKEARSQEIEVDALGPHVYGHVKDMQTHEGIDGVVIRSCLVGVTVSTSNGAFIFSEMAVCGRCNVTFRHSDYAMATASFNNPDCYYAEINMGTVYMNRTTPTTTTTIDDYDGDGVADEDDNCWNVPNGRLKGTCICSWAKSGRVCYKHEDCGTCNGPGFCSLRQEYIFRELDKGDACSSECYAAGDDLECCYLY